MMFSTYTTCTPLVLSSIYLRCLSNNQVKYNSFYFLNFSTIIVVKNIEIVYQVLVFTYVHCLAAVLTILEIVYLLIFNIYLINIPIVYHEHCRKSKFLRLIFIAY